MATSEPSSRRSVPFLLGSSGPDLTKAEWDRRRKQVAAKAGQPCEICGGRPVAPTTTIFTLRPFRRWQGVPALPFTEDRGSAPPRSRL